MVFKVTCFLFNDNTFCQEPMNYRTVTENRTCVSTGPRGAWHLLNFRTSHLAPADFEVLGTIYINKHKCEGLKKGTYGGKLIYNYYIKNE